MNIPWRWKIFVLVFAYMLAFAIVFQSIPPVLGLMIADLGLSRTQAGLMMSLFALPGIVISIPGGMLADYYGPRRVGSAALLLMVAGTLMLGLGSSFVFLAAGRIVSGIGSMTLAIVAPQTISRLFSGRELGTAMGIFNTAMPVGTIFTLNVFGRLGSAWGWEIPIFFTTVYSAVILLFFYRLHPDTREQPGTAGSGNVGGNVSNVGGNGNGSGGNGSNVGGNGSGGALQRSFASLKDMDRRMWLVAAAWMAFNAAGISFLTFAPDYYTTVGYDIAYAGFLASLFMTGSLILSPVVGILVGRYGKIEPFIIAGGLLMAFFLVLIPRAELNPLLLGILIGITVGLIPAPIFSLVPRLLPPAKMGLGYGALSACLNVGVLLGPFAVGYSYDHSGSYEYGFYLMALFALGAVAITAVLKVLRRE